VFYIWSAVGGAGKKGVHVCEMPYWYPEMFKYVMRKDISVIFFALQLMYTGLLKRFRKE